MIHLRRLISLDSFKTPRDSEEFLYESLLQFSFDQSGEQKMAARGFSRDSFDSSRIPSIFFQES